MESASENVFLIFSRAVLSSFVRSAIRADENVGGAQPSPPSFAKAAPPISAAKNQMRGASCGEVDRGMSLCGCCIHTAMKTFMTFKFRLFNLKPETKQL